MRPPKRPLQTKPRVDVATLAGVVVIDMAHVAVAAIARAGTRFSISLPAPLARRTPLPLPAKIVPVKIPYRRHGGLALWQPARPSGAGPRHPGHPGHPDDPVHGRRPRISADARAPAIAGATILVPVKFVPDNVPKPLRMRLTVYAVARVAHLRRSVCVCVCVCVSNPRQSSSPAEYVARSPISDAESNSSRSPSHSPVALSQVTRNHGKSLHQAKGVINASSPFWGRRVNSSLGHRIQFSRKSGTNVSRARSRPPQTTFIQNEPQWRGLGRYTSVCRRR